MDDSETDIDHCMYQYNYTFWTFVDDKDFYD